MSRKSGKRSTADKSAEETKSPADKSAGDKDSTADNSAGGENSPAELSAGVKSLAADNSAVEKNSTTDNSARKKKRKKIRASSKDNSNDNDGRRINSSDEFEIPVITQANKDMASALSHDDDDDSYQSYSSSHTHNPDNDSDNSSDDPCKDEEFGNNQFWNEGESEKQRRMNPIEWLTQQWRRLMLRRRNNSLPIDKTEAWSIVSRRYPCELALT